VSWPGDITGLQHFVQVAPLVLLAIVAWKRPRIGGRALIGIGHRWPSFIHL
jgi:hypothetical protein